MASVSILSFFVLMIIPFCMAQNINTLFTGDVLYSGQSINLGSYVFIMQSDCNLVLYDSGRPVWASNTGGVASGCYCTMQRDGNLVVYSGNGQPIWASNSNQGDGNYVLVLQRDRNVVIYGCPIWATGSNSYGTGVTIVSAKNNVTTSALPVVVNEIKTSGKKIATVTEK